MNALINWFVEGIDGVLVILVCAAFILSALSSFFGRAKVRWWFTCGDRWRRRRPLIDLFPGRRHCTIRHLRMRGCGYRKPFPATTKSVKN
jgi:hypothetical protein